MDTKFMDKITLSWFLNDGNYPLLIDTSMHVYQRSPTTKNNFRNVNFFQEWSRNQCWLVSYGLFGLFHLAKTPTLRPCSCGGGFGVKRGLRPKKWDHILKAVLIQKRVIIQKGGSNPKSKETVKNKSVDDQHILC